MIAITSIGFNRIERQQYCINTWQNLGLRVIAVQAPNEIEKLEAQFPNVVFKECELPTFNLFSKNTPTIYSMCRQALEENDRILLINSDISIKDRYFSFIEKWKERENTLSIGIRLDGVKGSPLRKKNKWGIDAFAFSQEMAATIPDLNFRVGCPGWDFWTIYHFHLLGYNIYDTNSKLLHEKHEVGWNSKDQESYRTMFQQRYKISGNTLAYLVKDLTGR